MDDRGPPSTVADRWQELLADAEATATEYRERGWETLVFAPGDVTPLDGDPFGLDVLVPGDEFEALESAVEEATFDTSHVYRAEADGVRFVIVAVEASDDELAVVVPAFFDVEVASTLRERALEEGVTYTHVRSLAGNARVTFTHDDPELFF